MTASEKVERLTPTVLPREIWEDRDRDPWFAVSVLGFDTPRTMMVPGEFYDLKGIEDSMLSPEELDRRYGPIIRVYPPAPDTTGGQAETAPKKTPTPRLMRGDVWRASDDDWKVVEEEIEERTRLVLACVGDERLVLTRAEVDRNWGPLTLIERAGYRRTETTVPVWQLKLGQVVSHSDWADGAPVRFFEALDDVRDLKITCRPLGWISKITFPAARDAEATLWDEIDGGAR
ncbi:hypothetical protein GCM10017673_37650 [Streptosporangium violaceochromogenes]|nr:hypothetical protein GCM10017673_37650 [Streptosporangium violaceochromogenes]